MSRLPMLPRMPPCQPAAAMRNRKKNNPIDCGLMPKKEILQNRILFARREG